MCTNSERLFCLGRSTASISYLKKSINSSLDFKGHALYYCTLYLHGVGFVHIGVNILCHLEGFDPVNSNHAC